MVAPEPADEPVIPPVIVPIVQLKLLATLDVKEILEEAPLQMLFVAALVTTGKGFTVTVIVSAAPVQEPDVEVGVITYSMEPAPALLGLVRVWLIDVPEPATAPLILPVFVPNAQLKLLAALAVKAIPGLVPLQITAVALLVSAGVGFTVTVMV